MSARLAASVVVRNVVEKWEYGLKYVSEIVEGASAGARADTASLRTFCPIPRGRYRLTVRRSARGPWRVSSLCKCIVAHDAPPRVHGQTFCWLPGAFLGARVTVTAKAMPKEVKKRR